MKLRVHSDNKIIGSKDQFDSEWKIQVTMQINFISSKDVEETRTVSTKSDKVEIVMGNKTNDITKELRESLLQRYQTGLEEKMKRSSFVRDSFDLLYYHLLKTSLKREKSYIKSPEWLKKIARIHLKNYDYI